MSNDDDMINMKTSSLDSLKKERKMRSISNTDDKVGIQSLQQINIITPNA